MVAKGTPAADRGEVVPGPSGGSGAAPSAGKALEFIEIPDVVLRRRNTSTKVAIEWVEANLYVPWDKVDLNRAPSAKAVAWLKSYGRNQKRRDEFMDKFGPAQIRFEHESKKDTSVDGMPVLDAIERCLSYQKKALVAASEFGEKEPAAPALAIRPTAASLVGGKF